MKLSIIIPVYNEEATIATLLKKVLDVYLPYNIEKEIIIINDGSKDKTLSMLMPYEANPLIRRIDHPTNKGKTEAVKTGFKYAMGDIILIQDADLEYDPNQYPQLLEPMIKDNKLVVFGSRLLRKENKTILINYWANKVSIFTINHLFKSKLTDFHTCFKVFRRHLLEEITITSKNFSFDTELTAKFLARRIEIYEVPIVFKPRTKKEGKKMTWGQAIETYGVLLKCWAESFYSQKQKTLNCQ